MIKGYITVELFLKSKSGKTNIYKVKNTENGVELDIIYWYGAWRQYVFEPFNDTFYAKNCLNGIADCITELMIEFTKSKMKMV